jgi:hypothetical protein
MRLIGKVALLSSILIGASVAPAQQPELHAIVERDGTVVLCILNGEILFSDRCAGNGRLMIVQPIEEGEVVWRSAFGTVVMENESPQNPDCALSRAKWDPTTEHAIPTGKRIRKVPTARALPLLVEKWAGLLTESDISAFTLDLDNDGLDEMIVSASNVMRVASLHEQTGQSYRYLVIGSILRPTRKGRAYGSLFAHDEGTYEGGTDAIIGVEFKGVVPIAPGTGEIALLVRAGNMFRLMQDIVRFREEVQRIETILARCH